MMTKRSHRITTATYSGRTSLQAAWQGCAIISGVGRRCGLEGTERYLGLPQGLDSQATTFENPEACP
jgi:hypothetical protein